ncbi:MAG: DUF4921 family protein, partial [Armatimonadetes bacterium]|nr:DUF4921 family protein [Armatimonadota bacterium]
MGSRPGRDFRPELRRDPISNVLVLIADREGRPSGKLREEYGPQDACPFCPGSEDRTPKPVLLLPEGADETNWRVRVVPNLHAAVTKEIGLAHTGVWLFDQATGYGYHEVVIESRDHYDMLWRMAEDQAVLIIDAWCDRLRYMRQDPNVRYVSIFRNYRITAGASLLHPHSQIIAIPVTPPSVAAKLKYAREYYAEHSRCVFCDLISNEIAFGRRIIVETEHFIALAPYASRVPFEMHLYPRRHQHDILDMTSEEKWGLVRILQDVLGRLFAYLGDWNEELQTDMNAPYNLVLYTSPSKHPRPGKPDYWGTIEMDFHWHIEVIPRVTRLAGFE